jgi:hypothetical protein
MSTLPITTPAFVNAYFVDRHTPDSTAHLRSTCTALSRAREVMRIAALPKDRLICARCEDFRRLQDALTVWRFAGRPDATYSEGPLSPGRLSLRGTAIDFQRWQAALARLIRATGAVGLEAEILSIEAFDCSIGFSNGGRPWIARKVDIAVLEDEPSLGLGRLISEATRQLEAQSSWPAVALPPDWRRRAVAIR